MTGLVNGTVCSIGILDVAVWIRRAWDKDDALFLKTLFHRRLAFDKECKLLIRPVPVSGQKPAGRQLSALVR